MKKLAVQNLILNNSDIENKIQRIGLEILEDNIDQSKIILFGISDNGKLISQKLIDHINKISDIKIVLIDVIINNGSISYNSKFDLLNESIIIVGDVSQTGKTLQMVISDLMLYNPSKIKTSVIINRDQTMFPVKIDYSGLSLSTSVNEHVDVIIDKKGRLSVYLS
ncbi:phosphoribosyltransferase family protein [Flavobacteriaceae bacterium]|nr:phosphoribosyltransferase family protein [Flavobacteriaceae bacterium]MDA9192632.1 phosphoribosyltransferase family protein [Flavobacteriaceae bacterium]MDA9276638.1 phosphoribosyltransferase family protein [Flavobacteriaceae bacterium]MDA9850939.1 phosphoribosyltransferase family protein [Flavobacteriaceae bacterium]